MKINIIGAGNVGLHFAKQVNVHHEVVSVFSRSYEKARTLANLIGSKGVSSLTQIPTSVDLNIVCVSDDAIIDVLKKIPMETPIVHTSGSVEMDVLKDFSSYGILYPLQTFSRYSTVDIAEVPFLIEANTPRFLKEIDGFCRSTFSERVYETNSEQRKYIHLGAVIAANFTNYLLYESEKIFLKKELPFNILEPLVKEAVTKAFIIGPEKSQTGPAKRNDKRVLELQKSLIKDDDLRELYERITELIQKRLG